MNFLNNVKFGLCICVLESEHVLRLRKRNMEINFVQIGFNYILSAVLYCCNTNDV